MAVVVAGDNAHDRGCRPVIEVQDVESVEQAVDLAIIVAMEHPREEVAVMLWVLVTDEAPLILPPREEGRTLVVFRAPADVWIVMDVAPEDRFAILRVLTRVEDVLMPHLVQVLAPGNDGIARVFGEQTEIPPVALFSTLCSSSIPAMTLGSLLPDASEVQSRDGLEGVVQ